MKIESRKEIEKLITIIEEYEKDGRDSDYVTGRMISIFENLAPKKIFALAYWTTEDVKDYFSDEATEQQLEDVLEEMEEEISDEMISNGWAIINNKAVLIGGKMGLEEINT